MSHWSFSVLAIAMGFVHACRFYYGIFSVVSCMCRKYEQNVRSLSRNRIIPL